MKISVPCMCFTCALCLWLTLSSTFARADTPQVPDIAAIRAEMTALKAHYDDRITVLEARLAQAERTIAQNSPPAPAPAAQPVNPPSAANALNPSVSMVLLGNYAADSRNPAAFKLPGFTLPDSARPLVRGLSLGESELTLAADIDDKFYGSLTASLAVEHGDTHVSLEEAYFQTLAMPFGLTVKGGRFFSRIGYLNEQHPHADDFVDRPLPYGVFLNGSFGDDGLQLRWLAPTPMFVEIGSEAFRGDSFPADGASGHSPGAYTAFLHVGDDWNDSWSYRVGTSYMHADARRRTSADSNELFSGEDDLIIADLIVKWAPDGNTARQNLKLQSEVIHRWEDGDFNTQRYSGEQDGFYAQVVYQFMPRWRSGVRYDALFPDNHGPAIAGTSLDEQGHPPWRVSWLFEFDNSEFSRLRLQYAYDEVNARSDHQLMLNYIYSLGAHGAHQF